MCVGALGRVVALAPRAVVDVGGELREVSLDFVDAPVNVGDHVLVHAGLALRRIPDGEVAETLALHAALADLDARMPLASGPGSA
jgi:hydrogenase expression/formation protein HypC